MLYCLALKYQAFLCSPSLVSIVNGSMSLERWLLRYEFENRQARHWNAGNCTCSLMLKLINDKKCRGAGYLEWCQWLTYADIWWHSVKGQCITSTQQCITSTQESVTRKGFQLNVGMVWLAVMKPLITLARVSQDSLYNRYFQVFRCGRTWP